MTINRNVTLAAWAYKRGQQRDLGRVGNIVEVDAVEIALKQVITLECQIGIGISELREQLFHGLGIRFDRRWLKGIRLLKECDVLDSHRRFASIIETRLESDARIVHGRACYRAVVG